MNTQEALKAARAAQATAAAKVVELEKRAEFESSFATPVKAFMVIRRCIDTGRPSLPEGIFMDSKEAHRFAGGLAGYGIGKDIFVESVDLYPSI